MFTQVVTDKDGKQRQVVSDNEADLATGVAAVQAQSAAVTPNIDIPVKKGFDLLDGAADNGLTDGTGVHNSPRDAVRDDGTMEGNKDVPFVVPTPGNPVTTNLSKVVGDQKVVDLSAEEKAAVLSPVVDSTTLVANDGVQQGTATTAQDSSTSSTASK